VDPASPDVRTTAYDLLTARALAAERSGDVAGAVAMLAVCLDADVAAAMGGRYQLLPRLAAAAGDAETTRLVAAAALEEAAGAPAHGWEALTPTERLVAGLVALGRSNPDIATELVLSRSTVQTHVSHILAKLGARSRMEIARHALSAQGSVTRSARNAAGRPARPQ
jgi:DNA-binding NarL/FixJ family response regulator